ncbi:MAG TPA: hypothetical protein VN641_02615, partial [Urbifossiella sp.]|nr:hypothetical protein [Urbifossiella sp.]
MARAVHSDGCGLVAAAIGTDSPHLGKVKIRVESINHRGTETQCKKEIQSPGFQNHGFFAVTSDLGLIVFLCALRASGKQPESGWVLSAQQIEPNSSFLEPPVKPILGRKWPLIAEILDLSRQLKIGG